MVMRGGNGAEELTALEKEAEVYANKCAGVTYEEQLWYACKAAFLAGHKAGRATLEGEVEALNVRIKTLETLNSICPDCTSFKFENKRLRKALESADTVIGAIKNSTICIGLTLVHVDFNCTHCLAAHGSKMAREALAAGHKGAEEVDKPKDPINICAACGKFKSWQSLRLQYVPDSDRSSEDESYYLCEECKNE